MTHFVMTSTMLWAVNVHLPVQLPFQLIIRHEGGSWN